MIGEAGSTSDIFRTRGSQPSRESEQSLNQSIIPPSFTASAHEVPSNLNID
jgi:hypothetical protein